MTTTSPDLTCVFITANVIPDSFMNTVQGFLLESIDDLPLISVSQKPMDFGFNIVVPEYRSHVNIYNQALQGAYAAQTTYMALCEDDCLYAPAHFKYRPKKAPFAYNLGYWNIYTWQDPSIYNYKGRKNLGFMICDRLAFIKAMEERFNKYPDEGKVNTDVWAEPGKYERQLGVTPQESEEFYTNPPNIKFSHENELSFDGLGTRKRAGELRANDIDYWGKASEVRAFYEQ